VLLQAQQSVFYSIHTKLYIIYVYILIAKQKRKDSDNRPTLDHAQVRTDQSSTSPSFAVCQLSKQHKMSERFKFNFFFTFHA
jgi:hypothetical protein